MFTIRFRDSLIRLFGGHSVTIAGSIAIKLQSIATVIGTTGSGKTMVLSVIAHMFGCPAFRAVQSVDTSKIEATHSVDSRHVGIIRQNPAKNFLGSCVAEEIGLSSGISRLSHDEFKAHLEKLWLNHFDGDIDILERHPSRISSGQQQTLAVLVQVLRKPDFLLADEPLARLSVRNAGRVLAVLRDLSARTFIVMSTHEDAFLAATDKSVEAGPHHRVVSEEACVNIAGQEPPTTIEISQALRKDIEASLVNWKSYRTELQSSSNFSNMPEKTIKNISGFGKPLTKQPLDIDVFMGRRGEPVVSVRELNLTQGINIVYGENGSGKTLVGRVLGGDITINPHFPFLRSRYATVSDCHVDPIVAGSGVAGGATLRGLHLSRRSHFLSSNPEEILTSAGTIKQEVRAIYKAVADLTMRMDLLESLGLDMSRQIDSLSFGEKKLVSFVLLQRMYSLVVLDELFANLSDRLQNAIATQVLQKCRKGDWAVVVLTSNRPAVTIDILRHGSAALKIASE